MSVVLVMASTFAYRWVAVASALAKNLKSCANASQHRCVSKLDLAVANVVLVSEQSLTCIPIAIRLVHSL